MQVLNLIENHQVNLRHTIGYRIFYDEESITLNDQYEACKSAHNAHEFALLKIPGTDIQKCQTAACKSSEWAYEFARYISGADIEYCQKHACKDPEFALYFAAAVPGADIEYCRKACEHDARWLNEFDIND